MKIAALHIIPSADLTDRDKIDHIVYGCHVCATVDRAKQKAQEIVEEFQSTPLAWRYDPQLEIWVATDESGDGWAIAEQVIEA